jgi:aconitate hydratase
MGVLPLEFVDNQNADSLGLTGKEQFSIDLVSEPLSVNQIFKVTVTGGAIESFQVKSRIDTAVEVEYFRHGGILNYVLRSILKTKA